ncbi:MAG: iron-sulfur cluster assembly protein [Candidatus Thermoplasmatota archaeon]|nr:iron-sulfur cluster assembly protein [Candidatus Thermoplasmatota archaeon]
MPSEQEVMDVLKKCYDPEIPINVVDLGLIYGVDIEDGKVKVSMTLTSPGCPMHTMISEDIQRKLLKLEDLDEAEVEVVWEPPWNPEKMTETAKKMLGWGM